MDRQDRPGARVISRVSDRKCYGPESRPCASYRTTRISRVGAFPARAAFYRVIGLSVSNAGVVLGDVVAVDSAAADLNR